MIVLQQIKDELKLWSEYDNLDFNMLSENKILEIWDNHIVANSKKIKAKDLIKNHKDDTILIDTPDGFQLIGDFYIKENRQIIETKTSEFKAKTSNDHLFETPSGWKKVKNLNKKDLIKTKHGYQEIKSLKSFNIETVYDWEVLHENHRYWAGNGLSSHNTGKTFLALNACREAQKIGYNIIYCDSEAAIDLDNVVKFGINPEYFRYQPINTPHEFRYFVANLIDQIKESKKTGAEVPKIMIVLDSLGNLSTEKSKRDALSGSEKKDMTKQQELKSLFANVTMDLAEHKIPFIITAHTYESVTSFFPKSVMGGGCLTKEAKLKTPEGLKNINQIEIGDLIETVYGPEEVQNIFEFEKNVIQFEFEDDFIYTCSNDHRFLIGTDPLNDNHYKTAKELNEGDEIKILM